MSSISSFDSSRILSAEMAVARAERSANVRQQPRPRADSGESTTRQQNPGSTDSVETSAGVTKSAEDTAVTPSSAETTEAPKVSLPPPESVFLIELQFYDSFRQRAESESSTAPRLDIRI
jgi:hypothetical protein